MQSNLGKNTTFRFLPDEDWIEKKVFNTPSTALIDETVKLGPYQCVEGASQDVLDELKCLICSNVAWAPKECIECGSMVCSECVENLDTPTEYACYSCKEPENLIEPTALN